MVQFTDAHGEHLLDKRVMHICASHNTKHAVNKIVKVMDRTNKLLGES